MSGPSIEDLEISAGDDLVLRFTVSSVEGATLDGAVVKWRLFRQHFGEPEIDTATGDLFAAIIEKVTGAGIVIEDADDRIFQVTLAKEDTEGMEGRFYHEAEVTDSDGKKSTVTKGIVTIVRTAIPSVA